MPIDLDKSVFRLPAALQAAVEQHLQQFLHAIDGEIETKASTLSDAVSSTLPRVWACSEVIARQCVRTPAVLFDLDQSGDLLRVYSDEDYRSSMDAVLAEVSDEAMLATALRRFRQREWLRIVWRDIAGWADLEEVTRDLSNLATACVQSSLDKLHAWLCAEWGTPCNAAGEEQGLLVIGMGKLGAWELNVSSDIDLIFAYPEAGQTHGGKKLLSNAEFFARLGQKLIQSLDQITADGFVFRVDMRLRPFGEGGALVASFDALENYYQVHGREWERYAMIKARVIAGERHSAETLMAMLRPFIYRRYLDYGAYESLREMKVLVDREVRRKGIANNIKLGLGGIREVEFIGQVFQLIRGGQESELRQRRILDVLALLKGQGVLPEYVVSELCEAYIFLRTVEHRLQEVAEQQTHKLPEDELGQVRLAFGMGFDDWQAFSTVLQTHRQKVQGHFEKVFEAPQSDDTGQANLDLSRLWFGRMEQQEGISLLEQLGFEQAAEVLQRLRVVREGRRYRSLSSQGQGRLDRLMPLLVRVVAQAEHPDVTLARVLDLIEAITQRTVYLALLVEHPIALSQLVRLCAASPWIARYLTFYPILLDELMDASSLYAPPGKAQLQAELRTKLAAIPVDDTEEAMNCLRHFRHSNVLRVAAADIADVLPLMQVSDHLSWIAEVVLAETLELAWQHMTARHGPPACRVDGTVCDKGFAVVAYGKLGGLELGYGSDLDLVFVHGSDDASAMTQGPQPITASVFFARLGQRMIHLLTAHTPAGLLYEVDMRLRPDGASGMLVTSLSSFEKYQSDKAWTWEHQALVRARVVAGDPAIAASFNRIRKSVLAKPRDKDKLLAEVIEMREKMRTSLDKGKQGQFDLKQGHGGIVDIEFMVQYGVLAYAHGHEVLLNYSDNIRLLMVLAAEGVMVAERADALVLAYQTYRGRLHRLKLDEQPGLVADEEYTELRQGVGEIWDYWMLEAHAADNT